MNIVQRVFTSEQGHRDRKINRGREKASEYISGIHEALEKIRELDDLLYAPRVAHDGNNHITATMHKVDEIDPGKRLVIMFSIATGKPISAYLEDE